MGVQGEEYVYTNGMFSVFRFVLLPRGHVMRFTRLLFAVGHRSNGVMQQRLWASDKRNNRGKILEIRVGIKRLEDASCPVGKPPGATRNSATCSALQPAWDEKKRFFAH